MSPAAAVRLSGYATLVVATLLGSIALGRPALVAIAAPFALALVAGLSGTVGRPEASLRLARSRALEGGRVPGSLTLYADHDIPRLSVRLLLPVGLELAACDALVALGAGTDRTIPIQIECRHWGAYPLAAIDLVAETTLGFRSVHGHADAPIGLRVHPRPLTLRRLVENVRPKLHAGERLSRAAGEGIEFAQVRGFVAGDRVHRINWRASARRRGLYVNEQHPERNTDLVLLLDTFAEARAADHSTLDLEVTAAASLARRALERRDRVGLLTFGSPLQWLLPRSGQAQQYRIVDALLSSEVRFSYAWKELRAVPRNVLPPGALVVALSPLLDERTVAALLELRGRGYELAVIELSPLPFVPPPRGETDRLARRLWALRREAIRARFRRRGVPVVTWTDGEALDRALWEVNQFRRSTRAASA